MHRMFATAKSVRVNVSYNPSWKRPLKSYRQCKKNIVGHLGGVPPTAGVRAGEMLLLGLGVTLPLPPL